MSNSAPPHRPVLFQPPPGTRDFYPDAMGLRRYLEDTWRRVSLRHGFVEMDGPTFEYLDLYTVKSGDEIVSQLFHFESRGEDKREFALRPEFTPTLARMVAARANALPRPVKWFSIPRCYRAERPQKGRLREFFQWNVDMLGGDTPEQRRQYDLEVVACALDSFRELGLTHEDLQVRWNDRQLVENLFQLAGIPQERHAFAFFLLDRIAKLAPDQRQKLYADNTLTDRERVFFEQLAHGHDPLHHDFWKAIAPAGNPANVTFESYTRTIAASQEHIEKTLSLMGFPGFATYDASIVRGLAYYTGFVWEVADTHGENRAIAGGGRYDKLIEMFGGPAGGVPATGFGLGDVVLAILLEERGKLPKSFATAPDVFVINALPTPDEALRLLGQLRAAKVSAITSYKQTKNIGKLLQEASGAGARIALIFAPQEFERGVVKIKDLQTRQEREVIQGEALAQTQTLLLSQRGSSSSMSSAVTPSTGN